MKKVISLVAVGTLMLGAPLATFAMQDHGHGHGHGSSADAGGQTAQRVVEGDGVVREVKADAGKLTIAHGPMPTLNWPAMVMDFDLADPALAKKVKVGDQIRFKLRQVSAVEYILVDISHQH
jgi:Cu(I)/Ag(I) efflux system periplasmic protein CusF